ncbi:MAG: winged helix-turn-helix transcriptional regulator [Chloroflexi bacterium]|nr:winged helix-turn-helix transcriptional regulator [Chloroflexota bacterium]
MPPPEESLTLSSRARISARLEPALNALHSLLLLTKVEDVSGLGDWVIRTAHAMTPEERRLNDLVIIGFYFAVMPRRSWESFPAYLKHLQTTSPVALRDKMLEIYARKPGYGKTGALGIAPIPDMRAALKSADAYLEFLRQMFGAEKVNVEIETQAYKYVSNPPAMKKLIISHLRNMWKKYLAPEWDRVMPMLQEALQAVAHGDFSAMTRPEAYRWVTGHALDDDKWKKPFEESEQIIFVPSAHVGPYTGRHQAGNTFWVVFGARVPEGAQVVAPALSRADAIVRLGALTDDSRLRILKHIAEQGETRSQDIIQALGLSQPAVSRHLMQLVAIGYLTERRCDGAKCYALNRARIEETLRALDTFLLGR